MRGPDTAVGTEPRLADLTGEAQGPSQPNIEGCGGDVRVAARTRIAKPSSFIFCLKVLF